MAANTAPIFPLVPRFDAVAILTADGTDKKLLFTSGMNGSRINSIAGCSDDTASVTLKFYVSKDDGVTFYYAGSATLAAGAEQEITTAIKIAALSGLALPAGCKLYVAAAAAVTADKRVDVTLAGGDY